MDSQTLISQVREMQAHGWKNSDLWSETQDELVQIAAHLEQCPACREAFDAQEYPEATLIEFEPRLANSPISDWICDLPGISPDTYQIQGYEVIEKLVTVYGTGAHAPVPKGWGGHRVKIVRID
jgi:hypothetical protein